MASALVVVVVGVAASKTDAAIASVPSDGRRQFKSENLQQLKSSSPPRSRGKLSRVTGGKVLLLLPWTRLGSRSSDGGKDGDRPASNEI